MSLHYFVKQKICNNCQTVTSIGKINLCYMKLSKVNKVQNMLISEQMQ